MNTKTRHVVHVSEEADISSFEPRPSVFTAEPVASRGKFPNRPVHWSKFCRVVSRKDGSGEPSYRHDGKSQAWVCMKAVRLARN
jgi:hypothetical protein